MTSSAAWPPAAACHGVRQCILVVEDEPLIRFRLADGLREVGYHEIEACNADEALAILETAVPDLVISDVRMPGSLDGLGLLTLVRKSLPSLPVIITSGHLHPGSALADGTAQFISEPVLMESVIQVVQTELAKVQTQVALSFTASNAELA